MKKKAIAECSEAVFGVYPELRRMVMEAFDRQEVKLTRTQQIILITMANTGVLSMSALAKRINTSNEQATRAVSQIIQLGFMERFQNETNHRIVNIRLTDSAFEYLAGVKATFAEVVEAASVKDHKEQYAAFAADLKTIHDFFA